MAFYCLCMLEIALILCDYDAIYEEIAYKFFEHFAWIAYAMDRIGTHHDEMWDEEDGFYYDVLRLPDGQAMRLKVRSMVGLLPLCASTSFEPEVMSRHPKLAELIELFKKRHPDLVAHVAPLDPGFIGYKGRRILSVLTRTKLERILRYLLDEDEFLGPYGIRSVSRYHLDHPFSFWVGNQEYKVKYLPAESAHVRHSAADSYYCPSNEGAVRMPVQPPWRQCGASFLGIPPLRLHSAATRVIRHEFR